MKIELEDCEFIVPFVALVGLALVVVVFLSTTPIIIGEPDKVPTPVVVK